MRTVEYKTLEERKVLIKEAVERHERVVQEEFFKDRAILTFDKETEPEPVTEESIDRQVVAKIRERYPDENEEFKMLRLGILNPQNEEFIAYNQYVEECRAWGREQKQKYGLLEVL